MTQAQPTYAKWQNNTATWWFRDRGLRLCVANILMLFLTAFAQGYDGILFNGLQILPKWIEKFNPDSKTLGLIGASYAFPNLCGPFIAQIISDKFGRRSVIIICAVLGIVGPLLSGLGNTTATFVAGRVLTGCTTPFMGVGSPALIAEISHPRFRAVVSSSFMVTFFFGSATAGIVTLGVTNWTSDWSWRVPVIVQCVGAVPVLAWAVSPLMVESPRWLLFNGREADALRVLAKLHSNGDENDELVLMELAEMQEALDLERSTPRADYADFVKTKGNRRRLAVVLLLGFMTQMSGNGILAAYLGKVLQLVGVTDVITLQGIISALSWWLFILAIVVCQFVERIGRRPLFVYAMAAMVVFISIQTAFIAIVPQKPSVGPGAIVMIFLFMSAYAVSLSPLPFLYLTEILPYRLRSKGLALYSFFQAIWQVYGLYVTPIALDGIGWKYFLVHLAIDICALVAMIFLIQETKGRTLEEIDQLVDGRETAVQEIMDSKFEAEHAERVEEKATH